MEFEKYTLDCILRDIAQTYASKPAVVFEDTSVSFSRLFTCSGNLAIHLKRLGIGKDDKAAILLPNCIEYLYVYFALFMTGTWAVPLSTRYEPRELRNVINDSDAAALFYQDRIDAFNYDLILSELRRDIPKVDTFFRIGAGSVPGTYPLRPMFTDETLHDAPYDDLFFKDIGPDDIALLAYTSGTTGSPKGVMIPHKNLALTSCHTARLWDVKDDVAFSVAPLYAAQGFLAVLIDLVAGVTMKWLAHFNPNEILAHLARQDVTVFHTQPTMWSLLLSLPAFQYVTFRHLKKEVVSGSLCSYALAKKIQDAIGCTVLNAYGLIEATGVVTITLPGDPEEVRLGTVGKPIPGVEMKIVDTDRKEVARSDVGELAVRGYLMKGYYKNDALTQAVIDDQGWLYTGDLACFAEDGIHIRIVGRCKDMVIRGGFNVYPIDIEECLLECAAIEDAAVVGREDEILGECLVAFVIPKPGVTITGGYVKNFCRGKIANYKIPDEVLFVSQLPILLSGKVQKNILVEWAKDGVPEENRFFFDDMAPGQT